MKKIAMITSLGLLVGQMAAAVSGGLEVDAPAVYKKRCASCHGTDARGDTKAGKMTKTPDLTDPATWKTTTVEERVRQLQEGVGKMPKFEGKLSVEEMQAVSVLIREIAGVDH